MAPLLQQITPQHAASPSGKTGRSVAHATQAHPAGQRHGSSTGAKVSREACAVGQTNKQQQPAPACNQLSTGRGHVADMAPKRKSCTKQLASARCTHALLSIGMPQSTSTALLCSTRAHAPHREELPHDHGKGVHVSACGQPPLTQQAGRHVAQRAKLQQAAGDRQNMKQQRASST
jgi:hypothetical protein